mmetsp:Transcript_11052/g.18850  ORF Transcript_11052/g.18850 Transcript_11052/m.18850 type:complete len:111 (+) Transcript_11052:1120-1452(+)
MLTAKHLHARWHLQVEAAHGSLAGKLKTSKLVASSGSVSRWLITVRSSSRDNPPLQKFPRLGRHKPSWPTGSIRSPVASAHGLLASAGACRSPATELDRERELICTIGIH